ncbi:13859_t:CDS:2, partial [Funneliformis caledonium]
LFLKAVIHNSYAIDEEFVVLLLVFHFDYEFINIREILLDLQYYERTKKYTDAVVAYKSGSRYEEVINLMQRHKKEIDEKIFHSIT